MPRIRSNSIVELHRTIGACGSQWEDDDPDVPERSYVLQHCVHHLVVADEILHAVALVCSSFFAMARVQTHHEEGALRLTQEASVLARHGMQGRGHVQSWDRFYRGTLHMMRQATSHWPAWRILMQMGCEYGTAGAVTQAFERWLAVNEKKVGWWLKEKEVPETRPLTRCRRILTQHETAVERLIPFGPHAVVSASADGDVRVTDFLSGRTIMRSAVPSGEYGTLSLLRLHVRSSGELVCTHQDGYGIDRIRSWNPDGWETTEHFVDCGPSFRSTHDDSGEVFLVDADHLSWLGAGDWTPVVRVSRPPSQYSSLLALGDGQVLLATYSEEDEEFDSFEDSALEAEDSESLPLGGAPLDEPICALTLWEPGVSTLVELDGGIRGTPACDRNTNTWPYFCTEIKRVGQHILAWSEDKIVLWNASNGGDRTEHTQTKEESILQVDSVGSDGLVVVVGERHEFFGSTAVRIEWVSLPSMDRLHTLDIRDTNLEGVLCWREGVLAGWTSDPSLVILDVRHGELRRISLPTTVSGMTVTGSEAVAFWSEDGMVGVLSTHDADPRIAWKRRGAIRGIYEVTPLVLLAWDANGLVRELDFTYDEALPERPPERPARIARIGTDHVVVMGQQTSVVSRTPTGSLTSYALDGGGRGRALDLDADRFLSWGMDDQIRVCAAATGEVLSRATLSDGLKGSLYVSKSAVITVGYDDKCHVWSLPDLQGVCTYEGHEQSATAAFLLSQETVATFGHDSEAHVWCLQTGQPHFVLRGHEDWVVGIMPFGVLGLLTWSGDGTLRTWSRDTGQAQERFDVHTDAPPGRWYIQGCVRVDTHRVLSWDWAGRIRGTDLKHGEIWLGLNAHEGPVLGVARLSVDDWISWGTDGMFCRWALTSEDVLERHSLGEMIGLRPSWLKAAGIGPTRRGAIGWGQPRATMPVPRRRSSALCGVYMKTVDSLPMAVVHASEGDPQVVMIADDGTMLVHRSVGPTTTLQLMHGRRIAGLPPTRE